MVPRTFWCEVAHTAVHLINQLPSSMLNNVTPFERLFGSPPSYTHLRVSGSLCSAHLPSIERTKLSSQSAKCVFVDYSDKHKGFVCYDPAARRTRISRKVVFLEHTPFYSLSSPPTINQISDLPHFSCSNYHNTPSLPPPPPSLKVYVR